jgi:hypothetical protein
MAVPAGNVDVKPCLKESGQVAEDDQPEKAVDALVAEAPIACLPTARAPAAMEPAEPDEPAKPGEFVVSDALHPDSAQVSTAATATAVTGALTPPLKIPTPTG